MEVRRWTTARIEMRMIFVIFLGAGCLLNATAASPDELPPIDWSAVERAARKVTEGEPYILSLPARRRECMETARPYAASMSVGAMFASVSIRRTCLRAMILKLTEIYAGAAGLNSVETMKSFDWISAAVNDLRVRESAGQMGGCDMDDLCGGTDWLMFGDSNHVNFVAEIVAALAVYNATKSELRGFDTDSWLAAWQEADKS